MVTFACHGGAARVACEGRLVGVESTRQILRIRKGVREGGSHNKDCSFDKDGGAIVVMTTSFHTTYIK